MHNFMTDHKAVCRNKHVLYEYHMTIPSIPNYIDESKDIAQIWLHFLSSVSRLVKTAPVSGTRHCTYEKACLSGRRCFHVNLNSRLKGAMHHIDIDVWKTAVTKLLTHWSYCSLVLSLRYTYEVCICCYRHATRQPCCQLRHPEQNYMIWVAVKKYSNHAHTIVGYQ